VRTPEKPPDEAIEVTQERSPEREPSAVAFFPWVRCVDPITVGQVRILPYVRGLAPGNTPHASQDDLDAVLAAFADRPGYPVESAALLELDDYRTGMDASAHLYQLFRAKELVAFAALSRRKLFRQHFDYCNYHTYTLVVQRYVPGRGDRFMFHTRRRDGSAGQMWATDKFAHSRPSHVSAHAKCELDHLLLASLLQLNDSSPLHEAIREFNAANTDSDDVPEHVEAVMAKSAFEWLLSINTGVDDFVKALRTLLSPVVEPATADTPMTQRWRKRWGDVPLLDAWARDFCDVRGAAAHGKRRHPRFVWPAQTHLAFVSIFFPLAVKQHLANASLLTLNVADREQLAHIEELLIVDPFSPEVLELSHRSSHPWSDLYHQALFAKFLARDDDEA
jgi:hypothetical protein